MSDSLQSIDKRCVFRETFESEQAVRRNGGVPAGITFNNGVGNFITSSTLRVNKYIPNGLYSIRIKLSSYTFLTGSNHYLTDFRGPKYTGVGNIFFDTTGLLLSSTGIKYVNGIATNVISSNNNIEIVVCGIFLSAKEGNFLIGSTAGFQGSIELFEIYFGTLTAQEVKNLYENKRHRELNVNTLGRREILNVSAVNGTIRNKYSGEAYNELVTNGTFTSNISGWGTQWDPLGTLTWDNGRIKYINASTSSYLSQTIPSLVSGKTYLVEWDGEYSTDVGSNLANVFIGTPAVNIVTRTGNHYKTLIVATGTVLAIRMASLPTPFTQYFDNISVKEIIPSVINNLVSIHKEGNISVLNYDISPYTNIYLNAGSYDTLIGEKSILFWINLRKSSGSYTGYTINNGPFKIYFFSVNRNIYLTRNNFSTTISSAAGGITYNEWSFIVITSTSAGITNFYSKGSLSGTANQNAGVPVAGTNIEIGRGSVGNYFPAKLDNIRIIDGILTAEEIAQIYNSERDKYGL